METYDFKKSILSGVLFGIGFVAFVDEAVFHQLLRWHHFYDLATPDVGLIADGLFHAFSWFATIWGLFMYADLRRKHTLYVSKWRAGILLGIGGFQLYDGIVQHKILRLHQIRYVENVLIYDIIWNAIALLIMFIGLYLLRKKGKESLAYES